MTTDVVPEGLTNEQLELAESIIENLDNNEEIIEKATDKSKWSIITSIILASFAAGGSKALKLAYHGSICGIRIVKHFMFHGVKVSMDLLKKLWSVLSSVDSIKSILFKTVEGNLHTIGSAATSGLVFVFMAILETIGSLIKYGYNSLYKGNGKYPWTRMIKDLKKIWAGNLLAAGVTAGVAMAVAGILIGCGVAVAWPFIVASIAASIVGSFVKWWYNNRDHSNVLNLPTPFAKTNRDSTYKDWAKSDNEKNRKSGSGKEEWPEELDDLVWVFEAMELLPWVVKKKLDQDKIDTNYEKKTANFGELKGMEKMKKKAIWDFRKAICVRYVNEIQNSDTEVEKCIVKACQVRQDQLDDSCIIL